VDAPLDRAAAYDSFYLALTESLGRELWTADRHLCSAVALPWVRCVDGIAYRGKMEADRAR
jgi:hypothetical protein